MRRRRGAPPRNETNLFLHKMHCKAADFFFQINCLIFTLVILLRRLFVKFNAENSGHIIHCTLDIVGSNGNVSVLSKVGGLDLAGLCGVFLGGAVYHVPVLADGFISVAAALCAVRLCPAVRDYIIATHVSKEPAAKDLLSALGLEPLITANMHLGEGTGAVAAIPLLDMALKVFYEMPTFQDIEMEAYKDLEQEGGQPQ